MIENILQADGISCSYGSINVLKNVSINISAGETHAVIGPNGAGKTTLFKVLSGEIFPNRGTIEIMGQRVEKMDGYRRVQMGVGRTFQVARVFGAESVLQNMVIALECRIRHLRQFPSSYLHLAPSSSVLKEAREMLSHLQLDSLSNQLAGILAYGDRKRLELALSLALQPTVLMLDEPMAGMSPGDRASAVATIRRVAKERNISVLLTEHDMSVVFTLADYITVLNHGEVIANGIPEEVRASREVREVYLGHEELMDA